MAKILLISANTAEEPYPVYPLGMSMVAEAVRGYGHEVLEWDLYSSEDGFSAMQTFVQKECPAIIGLSMRNVDTVNYNKPTSYIPAYKEIVSQLRTVTDATIVLGGSAFTIFPEKIMEITGADYGIAGEGEQAFVDLIDQFESGWPPAEKIISDFG